MSKIYKIICNTTGLCYIGSTNEKYLSSRLSKHKYDSKNKNISSKKVLENNNYHIELIE